MYRPVFYENNLHISIGETFLIDSANKMSHFKCSSDHFAVRWSWGGEWIRTETCQQQYLGNDSIRDATKLWDLRQVKNEQKQAQTKKNKVAKKCVNKINHREMFASLSPFFLHTTIIWQIKCSYVCTVFVLSILLSHFSGTNERIGL